ncbi:hypothetical protein CTAYLR_008085 [Chrysophaeum taylorii]|uniref:Leucyl/phenylalanyl-tRNA--protein transferase n=1 Tax=Chrysophaeum taylorii TaxID=2483200 RepID=A0AAD7ULS3_9STRA|nr:hypothetical protein CTAYLR_008085 [Chrysophaeum taylorii]
MFLITAATVSGPGKSSAAESKSSGEEVIRVTVSSKEESKPASRYWLPVSRREENAEESSRRIARSCPWLEGVPFIERCDEASLERVARLIASRYGGEFCWASSFEPGFIAALMSHGFLTMAQRVAADTYALLPKLHRQRCALRFEDRRAPRSIRRKAKHFRVSCDAAFDAVVKGISRQHGDECWLYPPLVAAFRAILESPPMSCVRVHTFECWRDDTLVAGELGYACGNVYTSLSGFSNFPSAGSVQCAATANWLRLSGYVLWDLGMELPYKIAMGATNMPRQEFLRIVTTARARGDTVPILGASTSALNARDVLDADDPARFFVAPCPEASSAPSESPDDPSPRGV